MRAMSERLDTYDRISRTEDERKIRDKSQSRKKDRRERREPGEEKKGKRQSRSFWKDAMLDSCSAGMT